MNRNIKDTGTIQIRINLGKAGSGSKSNQKNRIRIQICVKMTQIRNSSVELKFSKSKNFTGNCFGNPTSWWPAAGPAQRQWWWRSAPSCSSASDQWPGPFRSTSPVKGYRVHVCSSKSRNKINNKTSVADPCHFGVDPNPRIHASDKWIRILLFSSLTFKRPTRTNFKKSFSAYYFMKVHLHHFSKIKSQKEVTKQ
jgi:hypothetical protein